MISYIRSSLIQRDVRALKYVHFMDKKDDILIIQWDRKNEYMTNKDNVKTFKLNAEYGKKTKSLFKFSYWNFFVFKTLFKNRNKLKIIQICDLDSFFAVILFRLAGKKVIFDVYDFFTDSKLNNTNTILYNVLYQIEMFCLKFVDLIILPLELRKKHLNFTTDKIFICENVPLIELNENINIDINLNTDSINVIYAGTLEEKNRGLEWIPNLAKKLKGKVHFYIAGSGALSSFFHDAALENHNITFLDTISHSQALALQQKGDLIYGIYRTHLLNNVMAAPNKFYESIYLGSPMLINKGVMIANLIDKDQIGFVVDENENEVYSFLKTVQKEKIIEISKNARMFWDNKYANYLSQKYKEEYQKQLSRLISV